MCDRIILYAGLINLRVCKSRSGRMSLSGGDLEVG